MRETRLRKGGQQLIIIRTDEDGTQVVDGETGAVIVSAGDDRHDEYVQDYLDGGWLIEGASAQGRVGGESAPFGLTEELSEGFGRGFYSIGWEGVQDACLRQPVAPKAYNEVQSTLHLITSELERSEEFKLDIQAKYSGFGGRGSASASFSRDLKINARSVTLVLRKLIRTSSLRLLNPTLTDTARDFLRSNGRTAFLRRYGDVFINEIDFGASLYIVFESEANSVAEAHSMRLALSGKMGPVSGSVDASSKIFERVAREDLYMSSFSTGVLDAPPAGKFAGTDEERLTALLEYFDNFEEKIKANNGYGAEQSFDVMPLSLANGAPASGLKDFRAQWKFLRECDVLNSEIDRRTALFEEAGENPSYEPVMDVVTRGLEKLARSKDIVMTAGGAVITDPLNAPLTIPLRADELPILPTEYAAPPIDIRYIGTFFTSDGKKSVSAMNGEMLSLPGNVQFLLGELEADYGSLNPPTILIEGRVWNWGGGYSDFSRDLEVPGSVAFLANIKRLRIKDDNYERYSVGYKLLLRNKDGERETSWYYDGADVEQYSHEPPLQDDFWLAGIAIKLLPKLIKPDAPVARQYFIA